MAVQVPNYSARNLAFELMYSPTARTHWSMNWIKEIIKEGRDSATYTRDMPALNRREYHLLFVYGTLKSNFRLSSMLTNAILLGNAKTECEYSMYLCRTGTQFEYPIMMNPDIECGNVIGELYAVTPEILRNVDTIESNGYLFERDQDTVHLLHRSNVKGFADDITKPIKAWMYFGLPVAFEDDIMKGHAEVVPARPTNSDLTSNHLIYLNKKG